jgi:sugar lactone lactonase YvrE
MPERRVHTLLAGRGLVESPRWHAGRFWFADWGSGEILAFDPAAGAVEVVARAPAPPLSFDFLPDGRMIIVGGRERRLLRREKHGELVTHADLSDLGDGWNEIVIDGRGNIYINGGNADPTVGNVDLVAVDGNVRRVAEDAAFPNGMTIAPDNGTLILAESHGGRLTAFDIEPSGNLSNRRIWAELDGAAPDGIVMDAEGAVWYADVPNRKCARVAEGGHILEEVMLDRGGFACMLGGPGRRTLYITAAQWFGMERMSEMAGTGRILSVDVTVPGAGWP